MDHMQPVPSSISHLVQVYQPATDAKIQNPQILHNSHPTLPTSLSTSDGKMDYQQTMTDVHMPSVSTMQNDMMNHNQIVMSQTHLQLPHTIQSQVIHPTDLTQQLQITSHMLLPPVPVYKQHMLVNEVQQYYGQYDYMKEPSDYIKEPSSYIKEPSSYIKETSSYIKETSSYIKEPSEYVKEPTDYMKEPSDYLKESSEYTKETSSFEQVVTKLEPDVQIHPEKTDENQSKPDDLPKLDSTESPPKKKKPRSETQNPSAWACNVRKLKHQRGEAYVSRRGKYVPERKIKTTKNCLTNCKYKCNELINDADRELIFKAFYSLNANEKKHFLLNTTERNHIKHSTPTENHKRKHSFKYFFIIRAEKYSVCKNFYLGTLAISQKPVYNVHLSKNELNIPKPDGRGHSETSAHALAKEIKDRVRQHIMSFETLDSKPIKQNSKKKQYLKKKMSIKKMFTMYYDECSKENATAVKESMYRKIFKRDFNLHFSKKSKKEEQLCCKCKGSLKKK